MLVFVGNVDDFLRLYQAVVQQHLRIQIHLFHLDKIDRYNCVTLYSISTHFRLFPALVVRHYFHSTPSI